MSVFRCLGSCFSDILAAAALFALHVAGAFEQLKGIACAGVCNNPFLLPYHQLDLLCAMASSRGSLRRSSTSVQSDSGADAQARLQHLVDAATLSSSSQIPSQHPSGGTAAPDSSSVSAAFEAADSLNINLVSACDAVKRHCASTSLSPVLYCLPILDITCFVNRCRAMFKRRPRSAAQKRRKSRCKPSSGARQQ